MSSKRGISITANGLWLCEVRATENKKSNNKLNFKLMENNKRSSSTPHLAKPVLGAGFWFIEYDIDCELRDNKKRNQCVSDQHPFEWLKFLDEISSFKRTLVSWKEITKQEYESGKDVFGIG